MAIVGFDDIALTRYSHPPLSTVQVPRQTMGTEAARRLTQLLTGTTPEPLVLPAPLVVRQSSLSS